MTWSSFFCITRVSGMEKREIPTTIRTMSGMAAKTIMASCALQEKARYTPPMAVMGAESMLRIIIIRKCWIWLTSLMERVISEAVPKRSTSPSEKDCTL